LNTSESLPESKIAAFIRCNYESSTKTSDYYLYSLFNQQLQPIESNTFEWKDFKCCIAHRDEWLQPLDDWNGNHDKYMRVRVAIKRQNGEASKVNICHQHHNGYAFKVLMKILVNAEHKTLSNSVLELRDAIKN
jgi:hypothetical protein